MKRIILTLTISITTFLTGLAQDLINKVPGNASMVIKYSGENFSKNLSLKKIDSYSFVKDHLSKALKMDSLTSLQDLGIDFEQHTYQFASMEDSCTNFVSLFHLNNVSKFLKLVDANYHAEMKPEKKNGYEFLAIAPDTYIGWNNEQAILVVSSYPKSNYYDYLYSRRYDANADSTVVVQVPDTLVTITPQEDISQGDNGAPGQQHQSTKRSTVKKKQPATSKKVTRVPAKKPVVKEKPKEIIDEEKIEAPAETETTTKYKKYYDSLEEVRKVEYEEGEKYAKEKQKQVAGSVIERSFNGKITSIENDISYKKVVDPAAHVSLWINSDNFLKQYWTSFMRGFSPFRYSKLYFSKDSASDGFRSGMNLYFDKDKMRIEQRSFSPDEKVANIGKDIFNSKQSAGLANLVNPDNIGYLSMSVNTEALANYYYRLLRQYLSNNTFASEYADIVDVYIDLLEIIIDEKAIAELTPGNYMFVLHDMKTKQVSYTSYEYDDSFNYKEVKKTKQELSPNFTFVMETKKEAFIQKIMNLPLKYAKKEKFNYIDRGGYYELVMDSSNSPVGNMYFMVKDGKAIVTTNKASIDMMLTNKGYPLDADTRNSIMNNNYSLKINSKRLIQQIRSELNTDVSKKISDYLEENIGEVKMESRLKDGMMQGTTSMTITGNHANSLEFFFNMIDAINTIMEKDKEESEKKDELNEPEEMGLTHSVYPVAGRIL